MSLGYSPDSATTQQRFIFYREVPVGGLFLPIPLGCICTWKKASWGVARIVLSDPACSSPLHDGQHAFAGNDPVKHADTCQSGVWDLR
jgi:hypothetical protein